MDDDSNKLLEIMEKVEELLEDNIALWSSPHLTQLLFEKLFLLIKCDRKEVRLKTTKDDRKQILFFSLTFSLSGVPSSRVYHN